ncbi:MAG: NDP-hexose 2,3-dehydratase family protein [Bacteroidales bacterium]
MYFSAVTSINLFNTTEEIINWVQNRNKEISVNIQQIPFPEMDKWFQDKDGCLRHTSGKFFSIEGIHVETDFGDVPMWDQPLINQPEIGYLGILTKEIDGVLYFLMQAKIEPGNVNCVQISPTLQATKSNYSMVHQGKKPAYLDYFVNAKPQQIILDQLQSEQGARFLRKRNRNIIIKVDNDVKLSENFRWMTLRQIKELMCLDNMVNMDTRTVISGIELLKSKVLLNSCNNLSQWGIDMLLSMSKKEGTHTMNDHLSWLTNLKSKYDLFVTGKPLNSLDGWKITDYEIARHDKKFFRVIGVKVSIANREVTSWSQPLIQPMQQGICALIIRKIDGIYHFLMQAKLECGNYDIMELAPTVQCLTGNVFESKQKPNFVDYVLSASKVNIIYDALQSEEGGRFYHEQNRNIVLVVGEEFPIKLPDCYHWMTLGQINEFLRFNNFLNIQARSLLAAIQYV